MSHTDLVTFSHNMITDHLAFGTSGNLSVREGDLLWITPSGVPFDEVTVQDLVGIHVDTGQQIAGSARPSSELPLHRAVYQARADVQAIVHTHSEYAAVFAACKEPVLPVHYQLAPWEYEIVCADYATYGTYELAQNAVAALGADHHVILLQNHGLLAVAGTLADAYHIARDGEWLAKLYYRARQLGHPQVLSREEIAAVREQFLHYGQTPSV
ncbi:MAG: class II aldolase family protein [Sulfobacillus thermosulfidooxidans]|uniref:class II aldolase/adducin family protein n=1 Tax=Sulfobacillus sp. hq2 TaxID=2039167 RepID=UPI000CD04211|nr:class II aldolase/adducin family protein [Sulfobacillus sp. hq2]POB12088.1 aldolase [Sulfobacillus sp. hq2]PSR37803.1 MAG: class II aldolase family protein [Sulfobacillus thermosulfidooxidans]